HILSISVFLLNVAVVWYMARVLQSKRKERNASTI
ncbi:MAG: uncharacterized membrane protein (DUF2068 family), partial [Marinomonas primoryensis]